MRSVSFLASALWGLALLACFVGWGRWLSLGLGVRERAHAGLELVWGFALTLSVGGWLMCLGLARRPVLTALVGLGVAGCFVRSRRASAGAQAEASGLALRAGVLLLCIGLLGFAFALGLLDPQYQAPDDNAAYFFHAQKILETGSLYEPFSFRRLASYGGQSLLHALLLIAAPFEQLNLLDKGVCRVAVALAVLAHVLAGPGRSLLAVVVVAYAVAAFPDIASNTSSIFSGVLAFVGLWLTLAFCRRTDVAPVPKGALTGLVIAGVLPLRQNYGLACALVVLLEHAHRFWSVRDRSQWTELAAGAGFAALGLGGWVLLQIDSGGTPLYPLLQGFANPEWRAVSAGSLGAFWTALQSFVRWPLLAVELALCLLALWPRRRGEAAGLRPLAAAALLAFPVNAWMLAHVHPNDLARYTAAFLLPIALFVSAGAATTLAELRGTAALRDPRVWLCGLGLLALLWLLPPTTQLAKRTNVLQSRIQRAGDPAREAARARLYGQLQSAAPAGAKLVVMLDDPYLLDLRRNDVVSLDLPGGVSPPPGLHRLERPEEVVRYLVGLDRPWLAAVRPEKSRRLYSLRTWARHVEGKKRWWHYHPSDVSTWQVMGRTVARFFGQLDVITRSCRLSYDDGALVMIDLSSCRFASSQSPGS